MVVAFGRMRGCAIVPCHATGLPGPILLRKSATAELGANCIPVTAVTSARNCLATSWKNLATRLMAFLSVDAQRDTLSANHSANPNQYVLKSISAVAGSNRCAGVNFAKNSPAPKRLRREFINCSIVMFCAVAFHARYSAMIASCVAFGAFTNAANSTPCPSSCDMVSSVSSSEDAVSDKLITSASCAGP